MQDREWWEARRTELMEKLRRGLHFHCQPNGAWTPVGHTKAGRPLKLCGTIRCFKLRIKNLRPEHLR